MSLHTVAVNTATSSPQCIQVKYFKQAVLLQYVKLRKAHTATLLAMAAVPAARHALHSGKLKGK
jgi:hypothetical protein